MTKITLFYFFMSLFTGILVLYMVHPTPKVILKYILSIPLNIGQQEKKLFTVIYSIRWLINDKRTDLLKLFEPKTLESFKVLNHNDPISETRTFLMILEGTFLYVLKNDSQDSLLIFDNLLDKFNL